MNIAFYGSSLVSAYWNGAATYYRGIIKALNLGGGHEITFFEPDAFDRQKNRDIPDPAWARVNVYENHPRGLKQALADGREADLVIKASGVGVFDAELEAAVLNARRDRQQVAFWDVDAPATLERVRDNAADPFLRLIPRYDCIFTYGGGDPVVRAYRSLGAKQCLPIYNAVDPDTHFPVPPEDRFRCDLSFLGNRLPDREARVEEFFLAPAAALPERSFILGGSGWGDKPMSGNVRYIGHVSSNDHNAFNSSPRAVLNISRDSMARFGFSPATRVFEAAGAGACIITDYWEGIETFFEPGKEILVARDGRELAGILQSLDGKRAREIGAAARKKVLSRHTYRHRASEVEHALREMAVA